MANNCSYASFIVTIKPEAADWLFRLYTLTTGLSEDEAAELETDEEDLKESLAEHKETPIDTYGLEIIQDTEGSLMFSGDGERFHIDYAAWLIAEALRRFDCPEVVSFEWADVSPRLNETGGGAVIISKDKVQGMDTKSWIGLTLNEMSAKATGKPTADEYLGMTVIEAFMLYNYNVSLDDQFEAVYGAVSDEAYRQEKLCLIRDKPLHWWGELDVSHKHRLIKAIMEKHNKEAGRRLQG
jgi:hypothetical protein